MRLGGGWFSVRNDDPLFLPFSPAEPEPAQPAQSKTGKYVPPSLRDGGTRRGESMQPNRRGGCKLLCLSALCTHARFEATIFLTRSINIAILTRLIDCRDDTKCLCNDIFDNHQLCRDNNQVDKDRSLSLSASHTCAILISIYCPALHHTSAGVLSDIPDLNNIVCLLLTADDNATIRVTNLSEDTRETDLQELFRPFGSISRIYLAKDKNTGQSKVSAHHENK